MDIEALHVIRDFAAQTIDARDSGQLFWFRRKPSAFTQRNPLNAYHLELMVDDFAANNGMTRNDLLSDELFISETSLNGILFHELMRGGKFNMYKKHFNEAITAVAASDGGAVLDESYGGDPFKAMVEVMSVLSGYSREKGLECAGLLPGLDRAQLYGIFGVNKKQIEGILRVLKNDPYGGDSIYESHKNFIP